MSAGEDEKQISVRVDVELVNDVDRQILEAKASGELPMSYTRSDAVREFFERVAEDRSELLNDGDEEKEVPA